MSQERLKYIPIATGSYNVINITDTVRSVFMKKGTVALVVDNEHHPRAGYRSIALSSESDYYFATYETTFLNDAMPKSPFVGATVSRTYRVAPNKYGSYDITNVGKLPSEIIEEGYEEHQLMNLRNLSDIQSDLIHPTGQAIDNSEPLPVRFSLSYLRNTDVSKVRVNEAGNYNVDDLVELAVKRMPRNNLVKLDECDKIFDCSFERQALYQQIRDSIKEDWLDPCDASYGQHKFFSLGPTINLPSGSRISSNRISTTITFSSANLVKDYIEEKFPEGRFHFVESNDIIKLFPTREEFEKSDNYDQSLRATDEELSAAEGTGLGPFLKDIKGHTAWTELCRDIAINYFVTEVVPLAANLKQDAIVVIGEHCYRDSAYGVIDIHYSTEKVDDEDYKVLAQPLSVGKNDSQYDRIISAIMSDRTIEDLGWGAMVIPF